MFRYNCGVEDDHRKSSLDAALARTVPPDKLPMIVGEALRNAGVLEVPGEGAFRAFVVGPLRLAAEKVIGVEAAETMMNDVLRSFAQQQQDTPTPRRAGVVSAPPRHSSSPAPNETLGYDQRQGQRRHVAFVCDDKDKTKAMRALMKPRGVFVLALAEAGAELMCAQLGVNVVVAYRSRGGEELRQKLSAEHGGSAPRCVLLSDDDALDEELAHAVERAMP